MKDYDIDGSYSSDQLVKDDNIRISTGKPELVWVADRIWMGINGRMESEVYSTSGGIADTDLKFSFQCWIDNSHESTPPSLSDTNIRYYLGTFIAGSNSRRFQVPYPLDTVVRDRIHIRLVTAVELGTSSWYNVVDVTRISNGTLIYKYE